MQADEHGERECLCVGLEGEEEREFPEIQGVFDDDVFEQAPERTALQEMEKSAEEDAASMPGSEVVARDGPGERVDVDEKSGEDERDDEREETERKTGVWKKGKKREKKVW